MSGYSRRGGEFQHAPYVGHLDDFDASLESGRSPLLDLSLATSRIRSPRGPHQLCTRILNPDLWHASFGEELIEFSDIISPSAFLAEGE